MLTRPDDAAVQTPDITTEAVAADATSDVTAARVADLDELAIGAMKMAKVGDHRVVVARTASGYHALDNACPHQGYGLATGSLDGTALTCRWHTWRFDVETGACLQGEEGVAVHSVDVVTAAARDTTPDPLEGNRRTPGVYVNVRRPDPVEAIERLWPSLHRGIETLAVGQIARETARLLALGVSADEIVERSLVVALRRTEWGPGHELAVLADVRTLASTQPTSATLALVHGLVGLSEATHHRPDRPAPQPRPDAGGADAQQDVGSAPDEGRARFLHAIEAEDHATAAAAVVALVDGDAAGRRPALDDAASWFTEAVSSHHLSYGHGAIYVHKAFELLDRIPTLAALVLDELALAVINATREDTLPYMRNAARAVAAADVVSMAHATASLPVHPDLRDALVAQLVSASDPMIERMSDHGARHGVEAVLDVVTLAASQRMLAHDVDVEADPDVDFGWLDLTHALTYADAARGLWRRTRGPAAARLALWTVWLVFDAGRHQRSAVAVQGSDAPSPSAKTERPVPAIASSATGLRAAILAGDLDAAMAAAGAMEPTAVADGLEQAALDDVAGSWIVAAHAIKTSVAARREHHATGDRAPLAATVRFLAAPRRERFVARAVREATDFVRTGRPPAR